MKILELRFKNLNSLQGEWRIDFTHPDYVDHGIFALTGPTGAGKSTILDAICLALYGETPRLGRITQSSNEIMSRQTGECYAEVLFESQAGQYRCHWAQRRAKSSVDGKLQDTKHEIGEEKTGNIIEDKKSKVIGIIEAKTGMNFDRFKRSVLLAQGHFDSFLKSNIGDKSEILEQITGTEIYTDISKRVHEQNKDEKAALDLLLAGVNGIQVLTPEEENDLTQALQDKQTLLKTTKIQVQDTRSAIFWWENINKIKAEIADIHVAKARYDTELASFQPQLQSLAAANRAAVLAADYKACLLTESAQNQDSAKRLEEEAKQAEAIAKVTQQQALYQQASQKREALKQQHSISLPIWQQVRLWDAKIEHQAQAIEVLKQACDADQIHIASLVVEQEQMINQITTQQTQAKQVQDYLKTHEADEWLVGNLSALTASLAQLSKQENNIAQTQAKLVMNQASLQQAQEQCDQAMIDIAQARLSIQQHQAHHEEQKTQLMAVLDGKLLREYQAEKEHLLVQKGLVQKIASYEGERKKLMDGVACPVCGSHDHPYAQGNVPKLDALDIRLAQLQILLEAAETLDTKVQAILHDVEKAQQKLLRLEEGEKQFILYLNQQKQAHETLAQDLQDLQSEWQQQKQSLEQALLALNIPAISEAGPLLVQLQNRLQQWNLHQDKAVNLTHALRDLESQLKSIQAVIQTKQEDWQNKQNQQPALEAAYRALTDQRQQEFGQKNVDDAEQESVKNIEQAEKAEKQAHEWYNQSVQTQRILDESIQALSVRIENRQHELAQLKEQFAKALLAQQFANEAEFLAARLDEQVQSQWQAKANALSIEGVELQSKQQDREDALAVALAKNLSEQSLEQLLAAFSPLEKQHEEQQQAVNHLEFRLNENAQNLAKIHNQKAAIDRQSAICQRWSQLHALIGSADGKKYRNFAQGLTFEIMVSHANKQLAKMTDRYLLVRDEVEPLELNVIDHYQAAEVRSTKNLSGGESFIISLALALGLSKMSSQKVRVDSLFLDEGFGTLDEDSLETALAALASLHAEGKLIGVISHVSALKERIGTQIKVVSQYNGKSTIAGQGVTQL